MGKLGLYLCSGLLSNLGNRENKEKNYVTNNNYSFRVPLKKTEALQNRNGLCKALYTRLFDFIVQKINESLPLKEESSCYIGILDIAGFGKACRE